MSNEYYTKSGTPGTRSNLSSSAIRAEFSSITDGLDKLVPLAGNSNKVVKVNSSGSSQDASDLLSDTGSEILIGAGASRAIGGVTSPLQIEAASAPAAVSIFRNSADITGGSVVLGKSRGTVAASNTIVANGDELGSLLFAGADGTDANTLGASIRAFVDGVPGVNDLPGKVVISTTADGASTPTARLTIGSDGASTFSGAVTVLGLLTAPSALVGSATALATGRTIAMTGDLTWTSPAFDGTGNVTAVGTLASTGIVAGTYKSVTVDAKGRATSGTNPTTLAGFGITDALLSADAASTSAGKGVALIGYDPVNAYTIGQAGYALQRQLSLNSAITGVDNTGGTSSRQAFQNMIALAKSLGVNRIRVQAGTYLFDTNSEATCLKIDFPLHIDCEPGTTFQFSYYDLSLVNFVGANGGGISNADFVFTGTRPGSAAGLTSNHFGFNSTGIDSPPNYAAFISILGCNNVFVDSCTWRGLTTANIKEGGIQLTGGGATAPNVDGGSVFIPGANAVYSTGIRITNCTSNDVYMGISGLMLDDMTIDQYTSRRYKNSAFVGAGHAIYATGAWKNSRVTNCIDTGEFIDTPGTGTFVGATSYQFRSFSNGIISNLRSVRIEGFGGLQNNCNSNLIDGLYWQADRVPYEVGLGATAVYIVAQADSVSTQNFNDIKNVFLFDVTNAGAGRSANCPIMGSSGATVVSANMVQNNIKNFNITFAPDASFGKSVVVWVGQSSTVEFIVTNTGTGTGKTLVQLTGSAAGTLALNTVHVTVLGAAVTTFNISATNSAGNNVLYVHGSGAISHQNSSSGLVAGDRYICDDAMYSTRADLINNVLTHQVFHSLTGIVTVATPTAGLTYTGSVIEFHFAATGVFAITWPAIFLKAADGASAAGKSASTRFRYNGTNWVQQGGALAYN